MERLELELSVPDEDEEDGLWGVEESVEVFSDDVGEFWVDGFEVFLEEGELGV